MSLAARLDHLQSREDEARLWLLRVAGKIGESMGTPVHAVGGFVRDLMLGRVALDIDLVVEGEGIAFARRLSEETRGVLTVTRDSGRRRSRDAVTAGGAALRRWTWHHPAGSATSGPGPAAREPGRPGRRSPAAGFHDQCDGRSWAGGLRPSGGPLRGAPRSAPARPSPPSSVSFVEDRRAFPRGALRRAPRPASDRRSGRTRAALRHRPTFPRCPASASPEIDLLAAEVRVRRLRSSVRWELLRLWDRRFG